jgi:hypothetical protein
VLLVRDGERNLITADTRPCDLCMEDYELLEARFEPASSASLVASSGQQLQAANTSPPHPRSPSAAVSGRKSKRSMTTDHDGEEEEEEEGQSSNGSKSKLPVGVGGPRSPSPRRTRSGRVGAGVDGAKSPGGAPAKKKSRSP